MSKEKQIEEMNDLEYIRQRLAPSVALCQLAEEASELSQAALKLVRATGNGNPTPVSYDAAVDALYEEYADVNVAVTVVLDRLGLGYDRLDDLEAGKIRRWAMRLREVDDA